MQEGLKQILSGTTAPKAEPKTKAKGPKKVRVIDLGKKGKITIKKPGDLRRKADAAGESTKAFAESHDKGTGKTARESRAALGLMRMAK